ncbi:MAG: helix-turn-helix transcriptional regulator [Terracidiphilus sp.]|nr:helix-turn-helix transcriptional regulator [Terracidiphilus sp.]
MDRYTPTEIPASPLSSPLSGAERFRQIGARLKAYRMASGLSSEEVAHKLDISRAAVYRVESGEVIKIETLEKLAELFGTSMASLLGAGVEYHPRAISFFERMRQLEADAEQIVAHFGPLSFLLTTDAYRAHLRQMLIEATPEHLDPLQAQQDIDRLLEILEERKAFFHKRRVSVINLISGPSVQRFLQLGMIGSFNIPRAELPARRDAARHEVENLVRILYDEPMGIQIGVIEHTVSNTTFQLFRKPNQTVLSLSPFRLGETPDIYIGVAMITASDEAVSLYESMSSDLWSRSRKGRDGARLLEELLKQSIDQE